MTSTFSIDQQHLDEYMPKIKGVYFRNYHPDHVEFFKGFETYGPSLLSEQDRKQAINHQSKCGPTITAFLRDQPIAIFGCGLLWRGVGEAWSVFDPKARRYPIAMCKGAFEFFDIVEILFSLHRIQITVRCNDERAVAWAHYLGFESEGILTQYSVDKENTFIMRRT